MKTNTIKIAYLVRNSLTGGYWDGTPAPDSFVAARETATPVNSAELATIRATYENCEHEPVELQNA